MTLLGAEYALLLSVDDLPLDRRAPVVAAALLLVAELAYWSLERRSAVTGEPGTVGRRLSVLALLALGSMLVGQLLLAAVVLGGRGGIAIEALGAAAALGAFGLLWVVLRRG